MRDNNRRDVIGVILLCIIAVSNAQPVPPKPEPAAGGAQPVPPKPEPAAGGASTTETTIKTLCEGAVHPDACQSVLLKVANGSGSTEDVIKAGATVALQGIVTVFNLTDTLEPKVKGSPDPPVAKMAVDTCRDLFEDAIDRLQVAINQLGNPEAFKQQDLTLNLRLWLSDALTYADTCMDTLEEAKANDIQEVMKGGVFNATAITMSILDVFTMFTKAVESMGFEINTEKIVDALKNIGGESGGKGGRRLLGDANEMIGDDGMPRWLSAADRKLLGMNGERNERSLDGLPPNAVVALDGSGQFKTVLDAINAYPKAPLPPGGKYVIYVKAGVYKEYIIVNKKMPGIIIYGDGPKKTIITGKKNCAIEKTPTFKTSTFAIEAPDFIARDIAFENTAGPDGGQAVAFRADNERQVFINCEFNGYQDTLYAHSGSQFFRDCTVSGTVDYIFGDGATLFQQCTLVSRNPNPGQANTVTAQGRKTPNSPTALVFQNCNFIGDPLLDSAKTKSYLGRPWKEYARTIFMESSISQIIDPIGVIIMSPQTPNDKNSYWGEYLNRGVGAPTDNRAKWKNYVRALPQPEAQKYTMNAFLPGKDAWVKAAGAPYYADFTVPLPKN